MLPVYFFGNIHCFGMCGPLVMMIGRHKWRGLYFAGRTLSFTLAGWLSGSLGFVLQIFLNAHHLGALFSFIGGALLLLLGIHTLFHLSFPHLSRLDRRVARINQHLSYLILKDQPLPTFLFGFFTLFLPCGQTLIVFSAIALTGEAWVGALNGLVFALVTSPSLWFAMRMASFLKRYQHLSNRVIGLTACFVALLAFFRGLAELELIPHLILSSRYHLVIW